MGRDHFIHIGYSKNAHKVIQKIESYLTIRDAQDCLYTSKLNLKLNENNVTEFT